MAKAQRPRPSAPESRPARSSNWKGWTHTLGNRRVLLAAILVIGILAAIVRLVGLGADPPADVSWSQDRLTDPPQYTSYARTAVAYGSWNPLHDETLLFFRKNVTGLVAYLVFLIGGPGIATGNLTAVLLNLVAIGFLAWGTARAFGALAGLGAALVLAINYLFASYGRQPFLEVASNACLAVAFWDIIASAQRWWWALVAGVVAGIGTFYGKVTALHALPVFLVVLILQALDEPPTTSAMQRWRRPLGYVGGFGFILVIWYALVYSSASDAVLAYLKEQSRSLYGAPIGLSSFSGFLQQYFSFGVDTRLLAWSPIAAIVGILGLCAMLVAGSKEGLKKPWWRRVPPPAVLVVGWFLSAYLAFSPFNYRPVRYQVVLWLPLAAACGWLLQRWVSGHKDRAHSDGAPTAWWLVPFLTALLSIGLQHFVFARLLDPSGRGLSGSSQGASIVVALLISAAWIYFAYREKAKSNPATRVRVWAELLVALFAVVILVEQGRHFVRWWSERSYSIQEANDDLRKILGPGAVVTGEWAPPLTQMGDSPLSLTHFFSLAEAKTYFADNPITHVIVEDKSDGAWFKDFAELSQAAAKVTTYTVRHLRVGVWRVAELGGNPKAQSYQPSFLERLRGELGKRPIDSLLTDLTQRVADSANTYSGWAFAADLLRRANRNDDALVACRRALAFYPDDFILLAQAGDLSWEKYRTIGGPQDRDDAVRDWTRALELSPGNPALADRLRQASK